MLLYRLTLRLVQESCSSKNSETIDLWNGYLRGYISNIFSSSWDIPNVARLWSISPHLLRHNPSPAKKAKFPKQKFHSFYHNSNISNCSLCAWYPDLPHPYIALSLWSCLPPKSSHLFLSSDEYGFMNVLDFNMSFILFKMIQYLYHVSLVPLFIIC